MKSEPSTFSIDDLAEKPNQSEHWDGVRNYQARNFMRDEMAIGDLAFFYHSSCEVPGIVGTMTISKESHPDLSALNPESPYFDPKSTKQDPRWYMVQVKLQEKWINPLSLAVLKTCYDLHDLLLLKPGNRLSILPISKNHWDIIHSLYRKHA